VVKLARLFEGVAAAGFLIAGAYLLAGVAVAFLTVGVLLLIDRVT
jgi:hypothetical protein